MSLGDLPARVLAHAREAALFSERGTAILAVSGGPDSVALLFLMHGIAAELDLALAVGHVDHGIAADSGEVARAVAELVAELGVPFYLRRLDLGPWTSETRAREARYAALRAMQGEAGARYLVTAHHRDDQVETVLYRFLRGSGVAGLAGIPRTGPGGLVRPLLPFSRRELEEWLKAHPVAARSPVSIHRDPANLDLRHDRSWLRQHVMPVLTARFGDALRRRLAAVARHAQEDRDAWAAVLRALPELGFRVERGVAQVAQAPLAGYDKTLSQALLRALAREVGAVLGHAQAERLRQFASAAASGRRLELGGGLEAEIAFGTVRLAVRPAAPKPQAAALGRANTGMIEWGGWRFAWRREPAAPVGRGGRTTWVTLGELGVRPPEEHDRMTPLGGVGRRKVRRLLMEAKVPAAMRDRYPVVVRGDAVVWIPGVCRSDCAVPEPGQRALRIDADIV